MKIHSAEERNEVHIDINEVVKEGGKLNIYPNVKNFFSIDYKPKRDKLTLFAGKYIGLIPINDSLAIEITPKFSISNLTRIVSIAQDNFRTLGFFSREYKKSESSESIIFQFMVESLCNELKVLYDEGVLKEYVLKQEPSHKIRGRIDLNNSIKQLWSHGDFNKAITIHHEQTADNIFNQLIKYTIEYCLNKINHTLPEEKGLRDSLSFFHSLFEFVRIDNISKEYFFYAKKIREKEFPSIRNYYKNVCKVCQLIIEDKGVSFNDIGADLQLSSFTLDMESAFEKYLLNSLRKSNSTSKSKELITILDGNNEGRKKLYNQPSNAKGDAKPDIIISKENKPLIIIDAKYKSKTKDSDRYQVISHALSYNCKIAVLVLPTDGNHITENLVKLGDIGIEYVVDVYEYYFNLSTHDLETEEEKFSESLLSLLGSPNVQIETNKIVTQN